jgi:hypothetical protein
MRRQTVETITAWLMFLVLLWTLWDIRRGQRITQEIVERIEASAERIAQMTAEVLRRTPTP